MLKSAHDLVEVLRILPDGRVLQPESVSGLLVELQKQWVGWNSLVFCGFLESKATPEYRTVYRCGISCAQL
jgi:hypothetical protein